MTSLEIGRFQRCKKIIITSNVYGWKSELTSLTRKFTIATDLKLCNILLGLMSHSSTHPCCWCDMTKDNLSNRGVSRTIENMVALFWDYWEAKAVRKNEKATIYSNVIHPNMFAGGTIDESTPIILLVPPPELHFLIGLVNMMYNELSKVWPTCQQWIKQLHIKHEDYHGR